MRSASTSSGTSTPSVCASRTCKARPKKTDDDDDDDEFLDTDEEKDGEEPTAVELAAVPEIQSDPSKVFFCSGSDFWFWARLPVTGVQDPVPVSICTVFQLAGQ